MRSSRLPQRSQRPRRRPQQPTGPQPITLPAEKLPQRLSQLNFAAYRSARWRRVHPAASLQWSAGAFLMGSDQDTDRAGLPTLSDHSTV